MTTTIIAIVGLGILFAAFGLVQHKPECESGCGACSTPCALKEKN